MSVFGVAVQGPIADPVESVEATVIDLMQRGLSHAEALSTLQADNTWELLSRESRVGMSVLMIKARRMDHDEAMNAWRARVTPEMVKTPSPKAGRFTSLRALISSDAGATEGDVLGSGLIIAAAIGTMAWMGQYLQSVS